MSSQESEPENHVVGVVLIVAILMVVGLALGFGVSRAGSERVNVELASPAEIKVASASASASAPIEAVPALSAQAAAIVESDDASVLIENGVVKMYFASGKFELASGALVALSDAIEAGKAGKRLVLSGFHDATGDPAMNAELAKKRAMSVRDALVRAGVPESALELKKPEQASNSANADEARRVEVTIVG